jgi:FixJ family two-component response regulator
MKLGAFDYFRKPASGAAILESVNKAMQLNRLAQSA